MHRCILMLALLASLVSAACVAPATGSGADSGSAAAAATPNEWEGTALPPDGTEVAVWPESYAGDLLILDVLPHGSVVKKGDVLAHVDMRPIDEQLRQAELEAHSALVRHEVAVEKERIDREASVSALEQARSALDRARRALEGWEKHELDFAKRNAELENRHRVAGIEDETDELTQLEKMYKADELIDATEEIVMKRSKRALDLSKTSLVLSREQRSYQEKYDETLQTEAKREAVRVQDESLARLMQSQELERRAAQDGLERSKAQLVDQQKKLEELRRDRELLALHAPRDGILLHGSLDDYRPKETPPRHERGSRLATRTDLFTISDPDKLVIAVDVPESKMKAAKPGSTVAVHPAFDPATSVAGKLRIDEYPEAKSASTPENNYEANVDLDHSLAGLRVGMRVKVKLAPESGESAAKTGNASSAKTDRSSSSGLGGS